MSLVKNSRVSENDAIHVGNQLKMSLIESSTNWQKIYETNNLIMIEFPVKHPAIDTWILEAW